MFFFAARIILSNLIKIGVNVTEKQKDIIKWRLSSKGRKQYNRKQNNEFYQALKKGDMSVVAIALKDQQAYLDELKREMKIRRMLQVYSVPIFLCLFITSCASVKQDEFIVEPLDKNSLILTEEAFKIDDEVIKVEKFSKPRQFNGDWYIVHSDFIKKHKENIEDETKILEQNATLLKYKNISFMTIPAVIVLLMIVIALIKKK